MSLRDLYTQYHQKIQFKMIYIREAHPIDGWDMGGGNRIYDPKTLEERRNVAGQCESQLQYGIPTLVDGMDDAVMKAYAAWPVRTYLISHSGRIVYKGGPGPRGFMLDDFKKAIDGEFKQV